MPDNLPGIRLEEPELRFDHGNPAVVASNPYEGLRKYGPYDRALREGRASGLVQAVVVRTASDQAASERLKEALITDRMGQLGSVLRLHFSDDIIVAASSDPGSEAAAYSTAIAERLGSNAPSAALAFVLHEDREYYRRKARGRSPYYSSKAAFLHHRIPTQSIRLDHLSPENIARFTRYFVPNIMTAVYAKLGGIPWVVAATGDRPQITVGVGATTVGSGPSTRRYLGISTVFRENGSFVLWETTPLQSNLKTYERSLEQAVAQSIETYEAKEGRAVERLTCHISGREAGRREIEAVERGLAAAGKRDLEAAIIDVGDSREVWLFDGADSTLRPLSGYLVPLEANGTSALLHTSGRDARTSLPVRPLRLSVTAPRPCKRWLEEFQHLYDLRWMSWQSVGTGSKPVSIDYPQQMARLLAGLHEQEEVQAVEVLSQFKTEAWFL